jgi:hypothetical protein
MSPKNETKTANSTLSGSMNTPALIPDDEIHEIDESRKLCELDETFKMREKAKTVVTELMTTA